MAGNTRPEFDPLATYDKRPAVSFDPSKPGGHDMGEWAMLEVDGWVDTVQRKDDNNRPMVYEDSGKPMLSFVLPVKENGEDKSLWGKMPGGPLTALKNAQKTLQAETGDPNRVIQPGDTLAIRWSGEDKSRPAKMGNYAKVFEARVKAGQLPPQGNTSADPFSSTPVPQAPTEPTPQPAAQPTPAAASDPFGPPPSASSEAPAGSPFGGSDDAPPF